MKHPVTFYHCSHCGNIAYKIYDSGVTMVCCGDEMQELVPNTTDAALEKHVPAVEQKGKELHVQVGSTLHPMLEEHYIGWVLLEKEDGIDAKFLNPGEEPKAVFALGNAKPLAVYEWCNLHGLWKKEL